MPGKARRTKRSLPIGAIFLIVVLASVVAVILWPTPEPDEAPAPAPTVPDLDSTTTIVPVEPSSLDALIGRFLKSHRLTVEPGAGDVDLICRIPPGRSTFDLNARITRAMSVLGGQVRSGKEMQGRVDLLLKLNDETCRLRLLPTESIDSVPSVAIVIDDFGYQSSERIDRFLSLPFPFTPAVLPGYARSAHVVERSLAKGKRPILHLPMEPVDRENNDPGSGALLVGMDTLQVRALVGGHLAELAGVVGVNHHMGSRGSKEPSLVGPALDVIAENGLFYLDSATSPSSVCAVEAARRGVPCLTVDLFLDGDPDLSRHSMLARLREASWTARTTGSAIVIGHAGPATLQFLESDVDSLASWGCRIVPLETLLR